MVDFVNSLQEKKDIIIDTITMMCYTYDFKIWHLIIPPLDTIFYLCKSYDKTYMFLTAVIRTFIILMITKLYYDFFNDDEHKINYKNNIGLQVLYALIILNLVILIYIMFKTVHEPKIYADEIPKSNPDKLLPGDRLIQTR